jgi:hypothetical protein
MRRYRIERATVLALGFLVGASLAICIAPGDVLLWIVAGAFLSLFCHEQFVRSCSGELFWWHPHHRQHHPKTPLGPNIG